MQLNNNIHKEQITVANFNATLLISYFNHIYHYLLPATKYYPDFQTWYYKKVIIGCVNGERSIITETRNNELAGIAIIKNSPNEKKLSTLRVMHKYQNRGLGLKLFQNCFEELQTEKPFLTVSEEKYIEFKKIFKYYNFELTSVHQDLYRLNKKEYFFNEE